MGLVNGHLSTIDWAYDEKLTVNCFNFTLYGFVLKYSISKQLARVTASLQTDQQLNSTQLNLPAKLTKPSRITTTYIILALSATTTVEFYKL